MLSGTEGKSILIFGAGLNQLELIREARMLGLDDGCHRSAG